MNARQRRFFRRNTEKELYKAIEHGIKNKKTGTWIFSFSWFRKGFQVIFPLIKDDYESEYYDVIVRVPNFTHINKNITNGTYFYSSYLTDEGKNSVDFVLGFSKDLLEIKKYFKEVPVFNANKINYDLALFPQFELSVCKEYTYYLMSNYIGKLGIFKVPTENITLGYDEDYRSNSSIYYSPAYSKFQISVEEFLNDSSVASTDKNKIFYHLDLFSRKNNER